MGGEIKVICVLNIVALEGYRRNDRVNNNCCSCCRSVVGDPDYRCGTCEPWTSCRVSVVWMTTDCTSPGSLRIRYWPEAHHHTSTICLCWVSELLNGYAKNLVLFLLFVKRFCFLYSFCTISCYVKCNFWKKINFLGRK